MKKNLEINLINEENLSHSTKILSEFYANNFIPAEKKPYLNKHHKSVGPYMAVEGSETGFILDAASQIATLGLGFNSLAFFGVTHFLETWTNDLNSKTATELIKSFNGLLKTKMAHRKIKTTFTNSGAESNEVALGFAYTNRQNKKAKKVIAFEGSFHGRFLISLFSTWNKSKREPFQIKGYETTFLPFPELKSSNFKITPDQKWLEIWENPKVKDLESRLESYTSDELCKSEIQSLLALKKEIESGEHFAVIVEPMQCEGGDRYTTSRFFTALHLLCKSYHIETIVDEVQTGFHLGREFFWHRSFDMKDSHGKTIHPDYVTCAKKAQSGIVISTNDMEMANNEVSLASIARGYYHALALGQQTRELISLEKYTNEKLSELLNKYKRLSTPRCYGMAFAFDLDDDKDVNKFIGLRFKVGLLFYNAGSHTLRFRTNMAYKKEDIDFLFSQLDNLCNHIYNGSELVIPTKVNTSHHNIDLDYKWHKKIILERMSKSDEASAFKFASNFFKEEFGLSLVRIDSKNFDSYKADIEKIQTEVYEKARQTEIKKFKDVVENEPNVALGLMKNDQLVAISFAGLISLFPFEGGLRSTSNFYNPNCLYMLDTTTRENFRGQGLGKYLKYTLELLCTAKDLEYLYGRNRDQLASNMLNINLSLGLITELYIEEDYKDLEDYRDVIIYKSPLNWKKSKKLSDAICSPLSGSDLTFNFCEENISEMINKVCLSNFVSLSFLKDIRKYTTQFNDELAHVYTTSGQSECVDKIYKSILFRETQKTRQKLLTFKGHYFGMGSFMSRSLSSDVDTYFPVTHLDSPTRENENALLIKIEKEIADSSYLAIFLEPSPQNLESVMSETFLSKLKTICKKTNTRVVYNMTSTALEKESFRAYATPDAMMIYLGGQMGLCLLNEDNFVKDPLMLISTWDGDAFSMSQFMNAFNSVSSLTKAEIKAWITKMKAENELEHIAHYKFKKSANFSYKHQRKLNLKEVINLTPSKAIK